MSIPQIRTEAIEAVGRKILMEYDPSLLSGQPCPVPIETIIETKFDLILEFHTLRKKPPKDIRGNNFPMTVLLSYMTRYRDSIE